MRGKCENAGEEGGPEGGRKGKEGERLLEQWYTREAMVWRGEIARFKGMIKGQKKPEEAPEGLERHKRGRRYQDRGGRTMGFNIGGGDGGRTAS